MQQMHNIHKLSLDQWKEKNANNSKHLLVAILYTYMLASQYAIAKRGEM